MNLVINIINTSIEMQKRDRRLSPALCSVVHVMMPVVVNSYLYSPAHGRCRI